jgi:hypothetical protein
MNTSSAMANQGDFFSGLFENRPSKFVFMAASLVLIPLSNSLAYTIVWYERHGSVAKGTIVNRMFSLVCWCNIQSTCLITVPEWARFLSGMYRRFGEDISGNISILNFFQKVTFNN